MTPSASKQREYTISYRNMGGVDFSSETSANTRRRFSYLENMYRDYESGAIMTESIPGYRKILSLGKRINGMFLQKTSYNGEFVLVHAGTDLYRFPLSERDSIKPLKSLIQLLDADSCGFPFGKSFYIMDGQKMVEIDQEGTASYVMDGNESHAYIPTTRYNGEVLEQRNLLTDIQHEKTFVPFADDVAYESKGIEYKILDAEAKTCSVMGIAEDFRGNLYIPSYMTIGGIRYDVVQIYDFAFSYNTNILSATLAEGIKRVGAFAFYNATSLKKVVLPDTITEIGNSAFSSCDSLNYIRIGADLKKFGNDVFFACDALSEIKYALDTSSFWRIENSSVAGSRTITGGVSLGTIRARIKVHGLIKTVGEVYVNDSPASFYEEVENDTVTAIIMPNVSSTLLNGATVTLRAYAHPKMDSSDGIYESSFISKLGDAYSANEVVCGCTVAECFDGRIFLSGNKKFPNTVFYSAKDDGKTESRLYFGVLNYFNDGIGGFPVNSMLAAGKSLAVFKAGDDGSGAIFYHTPKETNIDILPKIYPVSYVHTGISAIGKSISFFDDPLFISEIGLCALEKERINLERSIACRSHNVNPKLLSENLKNAVMAKWCGYLFLCVGGHAYLADSREIFKHASGHTEYEWYYLDGIGSYSGDSYIYRFSSTAKEPYQVMTQAIDQIAEGKIYLKPDALGYYTNGENGEKYEVYRSGEMKDGIFSPATKLLSCAQDILFFGTESGDICVFNNDKRGIAPDRLREADGFSEEEYKSTWERKIHPDFYSFAGHPTRYALSTVYDDGNIPYFTKSSVKRSLTVSGACAGKGSFICEVGTNGKGYVELAKFSSGELDFSNLDFSSMPFSAETRFTVPIAEREKGWVEKQISIYSEEFCAPIGIDSISYRFIIKGRIKKKR